MAYPPEPITEFSGLIAVVTGGGTGMGRELVRQLSAAGCDVATCDVSSDAIDDTIELARADTPDSFEHQAPTDASGAAAIILDAVKAGEWRVLVGPDAVDIDRMLRDRPTEAYTDAFMDELETVGHFGGLIQR